jgi:hypothetical protein
MVIVSADGHLTLGSKVVRARFEEADLDVNFIDYVYIVAILTILWFTSSIGPSNLFSTRPYILRPIFSSCHQPEETRLTPQKSKHLQTPTRKEATYLKFSVKTPNPLTAEAETPRWVLA